MARNNTRVSFKVDGIDTPLTCDIVVTETSKSWHVSVVYLGAVASSGSYGYKGNAELLAEACKLAFKFLADSNKYFCSHSVIDCAEAMVNETAKYIDSLAQNRR